MDNNKSDKKIKVLHVLWSGGIGGAEEYVTSLIRYFDSSKYEIHLCFLSKKGAIFEEAIKVNNNISFIGMDSGFDISGALKFALYLYRQKFNIIHLHTQNILSALVILLFRKLKKILTHHLARADIKGLKKSQLFYKIFRRMLKKVIAISEVVREVLIIDMNINFDKIVVIPNGVDLSKYNQSLHPPSDLLDIKKRNENILGFVGRMVDFKRPDLFIKVAMEVIKRKKGFYFIMVGDGPELLNCRRMISDYGIDRYFKLLGFRRDIPNILCIFDGLFFPSSEEGFGMVILEAMAIGVPVFAVNEGAVPEIISHRKNGILLETIKPELIGQQIIEYFGDKNLIEKIKKQSIETVRSKFSIELCAKKTEELYAEILNTRNG